MAEAFVDDLGRRAIGDAVRAVEDASSVEVVVAVRPQSGTYLHADLIAGVAAGLVTLGFLLFSPWPFSHVAFLVDPVLVGVLVGWLTSRTPWVRRALSTATLRTRQVGAAAHATFHEKEVGLTHRRTGMLVYVSLLERDVAVLPDRAIVEAIEPRVWREHVDAIAASVRSGGDARALAKAVAALATPLGQAVPRAPDDVNELADGVDAV